MSGPTSTFNYPDSVGEDQDQDHVPLVSREGSDRTGPRVFVDYDEKRIPGWGSCEDAHSKRTLLITGLICALTAILVTILIVFFLFFPYAYASNRLPKDVIPDHYTLNITVDTKTWKFEGITAISLHSLNKTNRIVLNAAGLQISKVRLQYPGDIGTHDASYSFLEPQVEMLVSYFEKPLLPSVANYTLFIHFKGVIGTGMRGLYRSKYTSGGVDHWVTVTDFEPSNARRAFPCFDEPAFKANFTVVITAPKDLVVLGNMPEQSSSVSNVVPGYKSTVFYTTPKMSTYLVCFALCDYTYNEQVTSEGTRVRIYSRPDTADLRDYSLNVAVKALPFYSSQFGFPYPLPKVDLIALPAMNAAAMENWGLVTFRESVLLMSDNTLNSTSGWRVEVAIVVAHELAHQWFGNLVTLQWWNDVWLNEGFATYASYMAVDHIHPQYGVMDLFYSSEIMAALYADAQNSTHAVSCKADTPAAAAQQFDVISYKKGASLLHMLKSYLDQSSAGTFNRGVNLYLSRHLYSTTVASDLWSALGARSGKPVAVMMDEWLNTPGHPWLDMSWLSSQEAKMTAKQARDHLHGVVYSAAQYKNWWIPIGVRSSVSQTTTTYHILDKQPSLAAGAAITVPTGASGWVTANGGRTGFYRVGYPSSYISKMTTLYSSVDQAIDRAGLLDDVFALPSVSITLALDMADNLKTEKSYLPWDVGVVHLMGTRRLIQSQPAPCPANADKYIGGALKTVIDRLSWTSATTDAVQVGMLRSMATMNSVDVSAPIALASANDLFEDYRVNGTEIQVNVRAAAFAGAVKSDPSVAFDFLLSKYYASTNSLERSHCLVGITATTDATKRAKLLSMSLTDTKLHPSDRPRVVWLVASSSKDGRADAWRWLKQNWDAVDKQWGTQEFEMGTLIRIVCGGFETTAEKKDVEDFFKAHFTPKLDKAFSRALTTIDESMAWVKDNSVSACQWFATH